jgi:tRNA 2-thiouridine synthesizing protein E
MAEIQSLQVNGVDYDLDHQGFLKKRLAWNEEVGVALAASDGISLSDEHWEIIQYFREYYEDYNVPPPMRMVVRLFKKRFGEENANSRYLQQLFPGGPTRTASKFAGLPKPKNCK